MTEPEGTASLGVVPEVWLRAADVLSSMLLIRRFEERLISLYHDGKFAGHYHLSIGQEAAATAVAAHRRDGDSLHTTHRNHGHLLACGADPGRMFAEIFGREGGYNHGRGGTLHLASADLGVRFTSAMVGGGVLHAVGAAYAAKKRKSGAVAIAFFGDGTFEEGALYEAFNLAALWQLPRSFRVREKRCFAERSPRGRLPLGGTRHSAALARSRSIRPAGRQRRRHRRRRGRHRSTHASPEGGRWPGVRRGAHRALAG